MHKSPFLTILVVILILVACRPLPPPPSPTAAPLIIPSATPDFLQTSWEDFTVYQAGLDTGQQSNLDSLQTATVYYLDFNINADLDGLDSREIVLYTNREQVGLDEIQFRLFPNLLGGSLTIGQVRRDGVEVEPAFGLADSLLKVPLEPPLQPGESTRIEIGFTVGIPLELESNYGVLASTEGVLTLAHAYPHIPVYDDEGWNAEIPSDQGDLTYADAAFYLVRVQAPKGMALVASGVQVSREESDNTQTVIFAAGPARDFFLSASPDYQVASAKVENVTINSYAPEHLQEGSWRVLQVAGQALRIFETRYGKYPYTELDIVATPTYALGIEYPGVAAISLDLYDLQDSKYGASAGTYLESTVAHEVGHQWFYNLVGNDQSDEPWLDESLTQYVTWQYYLDQYGQAGAAEFVRSLNSRWSRVENKPIPIGLPVSSYEGREYGAIVYGRGAFFFEALEKQMGGELFDEFMLDYVKKHQWDVATAGSLKTLAEEHCSCDLGALFDEWVYSLP